MLATEASGRFASGEETARIRITYCQGYLNLRSNLEVTLIIFHYFPVYAHDFFLAGVMNSVSSRRPPLCISYPKHFLLFGPWFIGICHYAYEMVTTSLEPGKCQQKCVTWCT